MQKDIMNHVIRWMMTGAVMLVLSGCMPQYQMTTDFVPPLSLSGKQCVEKCKQERDYCVQRSNEADTGCQTAAHDRATIDYQAYQQQFGSGHPPSMKTVDDFYDDSQCQLAKRCTPVYQQCFVNCGGTAEQKKICVKNCPDGTTSSSSKPMSD